MKLVDRNWLSTSYYNKHYQSTLSTWNIYQSHIEFVVRIVDRPGFKLTIVQACSSLSSHYDYDSLLTESIDVVNQF